MTAAERLQAEKERLLAATGFYVPPYRMANLMKAAAKIMDIVIKADTNRKPPDPYRNMWPLCLVFRRPQIDTIFRARFL